VLFIPRGYSFKSIMVLGVREGHSMHVVTNRSKQTDEEEHMAPQVVRQVAL
jgi:hypothetical protein